MAQHEPRENHKHFKKKLRNREQSTNCHPHVKNVRVSVAKENLVERIERLRLEALGELAVQALLVGASQVGIGCFARSETDEIEQMPATLATLDELAAVARILLLLLLLLWGALVIKLETSGIECQHRDEHCTFCYKVRHLKAEKKSKKKR
jgi:hypothetical protein